ncbi:MAG: hypothetical protein EBS07_02005 [Sphingobacteriia bacterium]|nr:hypothetical protein [Sphingobacteriia bacterium]
MKHDCWIFILVFFLIAGCSKPIERETPTEGNIKVMADPAITRLSREWVETFQHLYQYGKIKLTWARETEAFNALLEGKAQLVILPRTFTPEQKRILGNKRIFPREVKVAVDAIAVILNLNNPDSFLTLSEITQILSSNSTVWSDIGKQGKDIPVQPVIDQAGSSIANFLQDSVLKGEPLSSSFVAAGSADKVIEYVANHPAAIGFIGVNWIASANDSMALGFLQTIRTAYIQNPADQKYYLPYQAWIGQLLYPLRRDIYALTLESKMGLSTGFLSFMAGDKGQRIVLKSGLMPAQKPVRMIELQ